MTDTLYQTGEYWDGVDGFHEDDATFKADNCLDCIRDANIPLASIKTVLDIGCGSGKFLSHLAGSLPEATLTGIDVSDIPVQRANDLFSSSRLTFKTAALADVTEHFDLVTMNDVFEHVDDYIGFLRQARALGSYFYFNIPLDMTVLSVARHKYMNAREKVGHLHYFSGRSAVATLKYAGYEPLHVQYNSTALHNVRTHPSWKQYVTALPRLILHKLSPEFSAQYLGGSCIGALCKPALEHPTR